MADLKSELSGSLAKLILGLMLTPAQYDAKQLRKAVEVTTTLVLSASACEDEEVLMVLVPTLPVPPGLSVPQLHNPRLLFPIWKESRAERTTTKACFALKACWELSGLFVAQHAPASSYTKPLREASHCHPWGDHCSGSIALPGTGSHSKARVGVNPWHAPLSTNHTSWDPTSSTLGHFHASSHQPLGWLAGHGGLLVRGIPRVRASPPYLAWVGLRHCVPTQLWHPQHLVMPLSSRGPAQMRKSLSKSWLRGTTRKSRLSMRRMRKVGDRRDRGSTQVLVTDHI